ncbi:hypothetical protein KQX62_12055 [Rhodopseudomonas palustris]|uniref:Uncharacterized protein n=1 Tax=Rhodopseudomonas palustris TaxID=1076 RepID=A0AAX3DSW1_RHOPL|nr:hypothetical protein [Rhodopseudomonas palustris]UYO37492.1 hypothetical protein KQX62_12055 [Rhodopseudomonas palustris]
MLRRVFAVFVTLLLISVAFVAYRYWPSRQTVTKTLEDAAKRLPGAPTLHELETLYRVQCAEPQGPNYAGEAMCRKLNDDINARKKEADRNEK